MRRLFAILLAIRHWLHGDADVVIERAPGEIYARCNRCFLRTDPKHSVKTGPLRVRSRVEGKPDRVQAWFPAATGGREYRKERVH